MRLRYFFAQVIAGTRSIAPHFAVMVILGATVEGQPPVVPPGECTSSVIQVFLTNDAEPGQPGSPLGHGWISLDGSNYRLDEDGKINSSALFNCPATGTITSALNRLPIPALHAPSIFGASLRYVKPLPNNLYVLPPRLSNAVAYEVSEAQNGPNSAQSNPTKPLWEVIIESPGLAALISVLGVSLFGTLLANHLQRTGKEREERSNKQERNRQSELQMAQAYLDGDLNAIAEMLGVVTSASTKAENLVAITFKRFQIYEHNTPEQKNFRNQVRSAFNAAVADWYGRREILGVKLGTHHKRSSAVFCAWVEVSDATTTLLDKSAKIYNDYDDRNQQPWSDDEVTGMLQAERKALEQGLKRFSEAIFTFHNSVACHYHVFMPSEETVSVQSV